MMKPAPRYPALRRLFRGTFHQDWPEEHETAGGALDDAVRRLDGNERSVLAAEAVRALAELDRAGARKLLRRLGGAFEPDSPAELRELLGRLRSC